MTGNGSGGDPLDRLRDRSVDAAPTPAEEERAWVRLQQAVEREERVGQRRRLVRRRVAPALLVLAVVVVGWVSLARPDAARAALLQAAQAARLASPLEIPTGSFIYVRSERMDLAIRPGSDLAIDEDFVAYLLPAVREIWRNPQERFIQIRTTVGTPRFFDPRVEAAYSRAQIASDDRIGETVTQQLTNVENELLETNWPTDAGSLRSVMEQAVSASDDGRPTRVRILDLAADLLRETNPSPALRAAILEVLAQLRFELDELGPSLVVAATYRDPLLYRLTMTLSRRGQLLAESVTLLETDQELGVPSGTVISEATFGLPLVTTGLGSASNSG